MRFLANENIHSQTVLALRTAGLEVVYAWEVMGGARDDVVLEYARQNQLIVITFDRDYGKLIYRHLVPIPAGVLYLRFVPTSPAELSAFILRLLTQTEISLLGKFTTARWLQIRQRPLPLAPGNS